MKKIEYVNYSYNDDEKSLFYKNYYTLMGNIDCYYMTYLLEDFRTKTRIGCTSHTDWQKIYLENNLIEECHLRNFCILQFSRKKSQFFMLPWDYATPQSDRQKDIILYRRDFQIGNGISFCAQTENKREFFAIAPDTKQKKFIDIVSNNMALVKSNLFELRETAKKAIVRLNTENFSYGK